MMKDLQCLGLYLLEKGFCKQAYSLSKQTKMSPNRYQSVFCRRAVLA